MRNWIRKKRRDFLRDRIITVGELVREFRRDRASLSADIFPEECRRLDALIEKYERRHESLLAKFKEA